MYEYEDLYYRLFNFFYVLNKVVEDLNFVFFFLFLCRVKLDFLN